MLDIANLVRDIGQSEQIQIIHQVRAQARALCAAHPGLKYLSQSQPIELTSTIGLVGHDGWADGRVGDYVGSNVMLNDYWLIRELSSLDKLDRWLVLQALGDEAAAHIRQVLLRALERYERVVLLTHVPPMREACWHEGHLSDDEWSPHFTCQAVGDVILDIMREHPAHQLTVLCGHTHSPGEARPLDNVTILTAAAEYGQPRIARLFAFDFGN